MLNYYMYATNNKEWKLTDTMIHHIQVYIQLCIVYIRMYCGIYVLSEYIYSNHSRAHI